MSFSTGAGGSISRTLLSDDGYPSSPDDRNVLEFLDTDQMADARAFTKIECSIRSNHHRIDPIDRPATLVDHAEFAQVSAFRIVAEQLADCVVLPAYAVEHAVLADGKSANSLFP